MVIKLILKVRETDKQIDRQRHSPSRPIFRTSNVIEEKENIIKSPINASNVQT